MSFAEILREYLTDRNLTQTDYAKKIDVKQSQVSEWLSGKAKPSYDILRRMALEGGVSADYFLGITDEPKPRK